MTVNVTLILIFTYQLDPNMVKETDLLFTGHFGIQVIMDRLPQTASCLTNQSLGESYECFYTEIDQTAFWPQPP